MNALLDYPPELQKRILVIAIEPGAYIYRETCAKVIHYRAKWYRDLVPRLDIAGAARERCTTITIDSHPDASMNDHDIFSPTYRNDLGAVFRNFIQSQGKKL